MNGSTPRRRKKKLGWAKYSEDIEENHVRSTRIALGFSQAELAEACGTQQSYVGELERGQMSPWIRSGTLRKWVPTLCAILRSEFSDLFPREVCKLKTSHDLLECQLRGTVMADYGDDCSAMTYTELLQETAAALAQMPTRRRKVLEDFYLLGKSLAAIGVELGISRERVRQIADVAILQVRQAIAGKLDVQPGASRVTRYRGRIPNKLREEAVVEMMLLNKEYWAEKLRLAE